MGIAMFPKLHESVRGLWGFIKALCDVLTNMRRRASRLGGRFPMVAEEKVGAVALTHQARDELAQLLRLDTTRRGDVYRLSYLENRRASEVAARLNVGTATFVYSYRAQIDAILDGKVPGGPVQQKQVASAIRNLLRGSKPELSEDAASLLRMHLELVEEAMRDRPSGGRAAAPAG